MCTCSRNSVTDEWTVLNIRGMCSDWKSPANGYLHGKIIYRWWILKRAMFETAEGRSGCYQMHVLRCLVKGDEWVTCYLFGLHQFMAESSEITKKPPGPSNSNSDCTKGIDFSTGDPKTMEVPRDHYRFVGARLNLPVAPMIPCSFFMFVGHP